MEIFTFFYFSLLINTHIYIYFFFHNINYIKPLLQLVCNCSFFYHKRQKTTKKISRDVRKYFISCIDTCKNRNAPAVVQVS